MTDQIIREKRLKLRRGPLSHMPELLEGELVLAINDEGEGILFVGIEKNGQIVNQEIRGFSSTEVEGLLSTDDLAQVIDNSEGADVKIPSVQAVYDYIDSLDLSSGGSVGNVDITQDIFSDIDSTEKVPSAKAVYDAINNAIIAGINGGY